jgi:hypothetical protein
MSVKIGNEEYDIPSEIAVVTSKWLVDAWEHLGRPETPLSDSGEKLMAVIISTWEELYPEEAKEWHEARKNYKKSELSLTEQVRKHTGRSLASYPFMVYQAMRRLFPDFKPGDRQNCMKLVARFPMLRMANKT